MAHREIFRYSPKHTYRIAPERRFYLDTSVIRRRASSLAASPLAVVAYTSALAVVELLARVRSSDRQYRVVRSALTALVEGNIPVIWRFPDAEVRAAFPRLRSKVDIYDTRAASLQRLSTLVVQTHSRSVFLRRVVTLKVPLSIQFFENYDTEYGREYLDAVSKARKTSLSAFNPESEFTKAFAEVWGLGENFTHDAYIRMLQSSNFNETISRFAIADAVREAAGLSREYRDEFFMSYDGSIDQYFKVLSWSHLDNVLGRTPGRNDSLDLAHLLYLFDDAHLVTADRALRNCAAAAGVSVIGPDSIVATGV